jgi:cell division protein FtsB
MKKFRNIVSRIYHIKALKYILLTVIAVVLIGFVDENSVWNHFRNKQRVSELKEEIEAYSNLNKRNIEQLRMLESDPKAMEKIARERYFMKTSDEDIFVLEDDPVTPSILNNETVE